MFKNLSVSLFKKMFDREMFSKMKPLKDRVARAGVFRTAARRCVGWRTGRKVA